MVFVLGQRKPFATRRSISALVGRGFPGCTHIVSPTKSAKAQAIRILAAHVFIAAFVLRAESGPTRVLPILRSLSCRRLTVAAVCGHV